jgi:cathepsin D
MGVHKGDESELLFGKYDPAKFIGEIQWHPVVDKLFWSLKLDDIKYNGVPLNICKGRAGGCMMTPDSGTSLLTTPSWALPMLEAVLP